jgi:RsiW-degrading membrane proteinase PrsW (M82 family)
VGYFIGLAARFPQKQATIVIVGLPMMATVHGAYDTFSDSRFALLLCVLQPVSVHHVYAIGREGDRAIGRRHPSRPRIR